MNNVNLFGRLAGEVKFAETAKSCFARFSVAIDRYHAEGENETDFVPCVAFGKTAEFLRDYAEKGGQVAIYGSLKSGSYENKDGVKVYTLEVFVDRAELGRSPKPKEEPKEDKKNYSRYRR